MKNILAISAVLTLIMLGFSSCYKKHDCVCNIKTFAIDVHDTIKRDMTHHTIKGTKEDADDACKYYETEEEYLKRPVIVYHYCEIVDDYEK